VTGGGRYFVLRAVSAIADTAWVRRKGRITVAAACVLACCLGVSSWLVVRGGDDTARVASSVLIQREPWGPEHHHGGKSRVLAVATPLAACEARIMREPGRLPTIAVVGASYTAGTGPDNPLLSWAVVLARLLRWNAVIDGVPGAGYVARGDGGHGPMARMLSAEGLRSLVPSVVIVQAGHDDVGVPPAPEGAGVRATLGLIHMTAPGARVALLTVFAHTPDGTPALRRTDQVIVSAARAADPQVIIMDPLAGQWKFQHANDGLHPTAAGDAWIAGKVLAILRAYGVRPAPATTGTQPIICDASVGQKPAAGTSA
jgi:lysophospholipase L1-like esterase